MEHSTPWYRKKRARIILFTAILLVGILVRVVGLGALPAGVDQDEAMAGYQAYTLLTEGIDLNGYHNPVYFEAWGNGQSVLLSYLMMPWIAIFGLTDFAIRLPQAIFGILTLPAFYLLLKAIFGEKTAWIGYFLLAINPWHIMMSRWALDCNLAPAFLVFGLLFFVLALEKHPAYYLLSALAYGLCLYCYALMWVVVPILLLLQIGYALIMKRARVTWYTTGFVLIVGLMAVPLLLLNIINHYWLAEIQTAWFSIPELASWRTGDLSAANLTNLGSFSRLFVMLAEQSDNQVRSAFSRFGFYYLFSAPFMMLGLVSLIRSFAEKVKKREHALEFYALAQLFSALLISLMLNAINANRINAIHIPLILLCAIGVREVLDLNWKLAGKAVIALYCVSFLAFTGYYFGGGQTLLDEYYRPGTKEAIAYAQEITDDTIVCRMHGRFSKVLYYTKMPAAHYIATVEFESPPYPNPVSFDQFVFESPHETTTGDAVYIIEGDDLSLYAASGYTIESFDTMAVAYLPGEVTAPDAG